MGNENIFLGIISIFIGIGIYIKIESIIFTIILIIIGVLLIIFYKEENKLEKRRDKNE